MTTIQQWAAAWVAGVVCLCISPMVVAQEAPPMDAAADSLAPKLDALAALVMEVPADEEAYTRMDLLLLLMKAEARAGRTEKNVEHFNQLLAATMKTAVMDGDTWSSAYLPAGHLLAGRDEEAVRAAENLAFQPATQLDAWQMLGEAAAALGDDADYKTYVGKSLDLFPKVIAEGVKEAKDNEWPYDGTFSAWYAAFAYRDQGDVDSLRRLSTIGLAEPMEAAAVRAVLGQVLWVTGDEAAAAAERAAAEQLVRQANAGKLAKPDEYWPDASSSLPELLALVWLLEGQDAAVALGEELGKPYVDEALDWKSSSAIHVAEAYRRRAKPGDEASAKAALDMAIASLDFNVEGIWFDYAWAVRELVHQGRADEAEGLTERPGTVWFRSQALMGWVEGLQGVAE